LMVAAGAAGLSVDVSILGPDRLDELGAWLDTGGMLFCGVELTELGASVDAMHALIRRVGLAPTRVGQQLVVTPRCGLAGSTITEAVNTYAMAHQLARRVAQESEDA
ncbi:MAG TPA: hypothetical protein VMT27_01145, partial [Actinomycetes bacterium]|nr:hypothetical protein [Actinomycetes bacterium]